MKGFNYFRFANSIFFFNKKGKGPLGGGGGSQGALPIKNQISGLKEEKCVNIKLYI